MTNKQEFYRQKYRVLNPKWRDSLVIQKDIVTQNINRETRLLDLGCGHSNFMKEAYSKTEHIYGIDPDEKAIEKNMIIKNKIVGFADRMPFADNFFDLIVLTWVMEHLDNPSRIIKEIYRVLEPGGKIIFLTPNVWNYNVWIIRMIPDIFHKPLVSYLYNRQENDTYPKKYKLNSARKIDKILLSIGLKKDQLILNGDPSYISFNKYLFEFACLVENLLDKKAFNFAKVHIIGVYQK